MIKTLLYCSPLLAVLLLSNSRTQTSLETAPPGQLAHYGQYIFAREDCKHCHTLNVSEASADLVSLDGLGGKYPLSWLYYYLDDPQSLSPYSNMPAFSHLHVDTLRRQTLEQIIRENNPDELARLNASWSELMRQADSLKAQLETEGVFAQNGSEVLALIAYLRQIPSSQVKIVQDSIAYQQLQLQTKEWQIQWEHEFKDPNSALLKTAQNKKQAKQGGQLFRSNCRACHGETGGGGIGPNLTDAYWLHGGKPEEIAHTIAIGVPERGMIAWQSMLTPTEVGQLVAYIHSIKGTKPKDAKEPQGRVINDE